eukprot:510699-Lingulodinium_polyedra.AAC.1
MATCRNRGFAAGERRNSTPTQACLRPTRPWALSLAPGGGGGGGGNRTKPETWPTHLGSASEHT